MIVETAVESYRFTCARCAVKWTASYQVRRVTSDAGVTESFYRYHGAPCEAPVSGNVACPNCRGTRVRKDPLYDEVPLTELDWPGPSLPAAPPSAAPSSAAEPVPALPRQRAVPGSWHRFKFSAVVTLEAAGRTKRQYPCGAPGLLVRVPSWQRPSLHRYFPAAIFTDDRRPLRPGDREVPVAVSVPDDDASGFFRTGQHFTLWDGGEVGHGTVARRLFFRWPELG